MAELKIIHSNMMGIHCQRGACRGLSLRNAPNTTTGRGFAGIQRYAQVWDGDNLHRLAYREV